MRSILFLLFILFGFSYAGTITGFVKDSTSQEPLYPVNIWLENTTIGTTTNEKGYFVLTDIPNGNYLLKISFIGYKEKSYTISLNQKKHRIFLQILLSPIPLEGEKLTVEASKTANLLDIKPGQVVLASSQFQSTPSVVEPDVFRTLQFLPGVATISDFSAGLYIRGGSPDQNLILLDQIDVYNPNHLFGFFSSFLPDAVKNVELLKGGFPARYGGRLSSVLNVQNKEGNREKLAGNIRVSAISSSLTLEGPWKNGSWMLAGRRTYIEHIAKALGYNIPYYFYDAQGKFNFDINRNNQFTFSFYLGDDKLDLSESSNNIFIKWGNKTFSSQWMHIFNDQLYSTFVLAGSQFRSNTEVIFDDVKFGILNQIKDLSSKATLTLALNRNHTIDFGLEHKYLVFNLHNTIVDTVYKNDYLSHYISGFAQDNYRLDSSKVIQYGIRFSYFSDGNYFKLAPRLSYKQLVNSRFNFTISYGKYFQFLNLVQREGFSFADIWFPVDHTFPPGEADHFILSLEYQLQPNSTLSIEPYFKRYQNLAEYREIQRPDEPAEGQTAAQNFYRGSGKAYGIDILLNNSFGKLKGWFGYSLAWVKKKTDGYNFNEEYFPTYDRRHTFTLMQNIIFSKKWQASLSIRYATGQPYTQPTARFAAMTPDGRLYYLPLEGKKNYFRLPPYKRVDIGLNRTFKLGKFHINGYLQILNVFNFKNVWFRQFRTDENPAVVESEYMLPRIPTIGVNCKW